MFKGGYINTIPSSIKNKTILEKKKKKGYRYGGTLKKIKKKGNRFWGTWKKTFKKRGFKLPRL